MSSAETPAKNEKQKSVVPMIYWLWRDYLRPQKWLLVCALFLMSLEGSTLALFSRMVQPMFDDVFTNGDTQALYMVGFIVMGIFIMRAFTSTARSILMTLINQRTAEGMREHMLTHMLTLDSSFFQTNSPGQLITRVQGDVASINRIWSGLMIALGRDLVSLIGLLSVALWIDWVWTLIAIIGLPLLALPSLLVQRYIRRRAHIQRELSANISTQLDEVFHGISPIKLNTLEAYRTKSYLKVLKEAIDAAVKTSYGTSAVPALIDIMTGIGFFGVLVYGGSEIIAGNKTNGEFMAFFTAISLAFDPIRRLGALSGSLQRAAASIERVQWVLGIKPTILSPAKPLPAPKDAPAIQLDAVELNYDELPVLRGTTFTAEAGKTTALVGASGAGKSTVFNVLTRLVDPQTGVVTVGGIPVQQMGLMDLRGMFSVVSQDSTLFDETLRDNILLGREDVTDAQLQEAIDAAFVSDFLPKLANGLDTPVGPRGSSLSGGQRQRVAIARALLRNTPILLLDEATSALDTKSEAMVQQALDQLSTGRTTLVIAHRLSTVRNAHSIVVMDHGRVVDQGSHDELLARGGIYADLHRLQFSQSEAEKDD